MGRVDAHLLTLIGEERLALVEGGRLVAMRIARDGDGLAAGAVVDARLTRRQGARGFALAGQQELLVQPWPAGATEGMTVRLELVRGAWAEPGRERLAKARPAEGRPCRVAPSLAEQAAGLGATMRPGWADALAAQWDAGWDAAELGRVVFSSGVLELRPTPAFLAVDVDGERPDAAEACVALAGAIGLWGLSGSIVLDLPEHGRAERQAAAGAFDAAMGDRPFERTAINGFGLLQVVIPRLGPSVLERALLDRHGSAAIALIAAATRESRPGRMALVAAPPIARWVRERPHLLASLRQRVGRAVDVVDDPVAGQGHVRTAS